MCEDVRVAVGEGWRERTRRPWRRQLGARCPRHVIRGQRSASGRASKPVPTSSSKLIEGLPTECPKTTARLKDPISRVLAALVWCTINLDTDADGAEPEAESETGHAEQLHARYVREMQFICVTHTLGDAPDVPLREEVVLGTILTNCIQPRWRTDRTYRMKLHADGLVSDIRRQIVQSDETPTEDQLRSGLLRAWEVWTWAQHHRDREFIESFSLIALGLIVEYLDRLGGLGAELIVSDISAHSETPTSVGLRSSCTVQ